MINKEEVTRSIKIILREYRKDVSDNLFDDLWEKELRYEAILEDKIKQLVKNAINNFEKDLYDLKYKLTEELCGILEIKHE